MRIEVRGDRAISAQARTYAEYRLFAALTQLSEGHDVQQVRVRLREVHPGNRCAGIACTVTVARQGSEPIRIRTIGSHAYAAINSAVDRLRTSGSAITASHRPSCGSTAF
jgi:ribosome-associated translation inhibitor RaiA